MLNCCNVQSIIFIAFFVALSLSLFFVPLFARVALYLSIVDKPNSTLKLHERATPYLGGAALFLSLLITLPFFVALGKLTSFLIGCLLLLLTGLLDDIVVLRPFTKLTGQAVSVCVFMSGGLVFNLTFLPYWLSLVFTFFWYLTVINAFNLIDVMDGLSSSVAFISAVGVLFVALLQGNYMVAFLAACFMGAVLGFFIFNRPPASIYMGDAGSLLMGGYLSALLLMLSWGQSWYSFMLPSIIVGVPCLELFSLILIRTYYKIPFFLGSRHHFCHYLLNKRYSKNAILAFAFVCSLFLTCVAIAGLLSLFSLQHLLLLLFAFSGIWLYFVFYS